MTRFPFARQIAALSACALCLCMALAASARADEAVDYPADQEARTFSSSDGNWTSTTSFDGSCVAPVLCPTIANAFVPVGGAGGEGYITAAFTGVAGVNAVAGTSTSIWESPVFAYAGARGQDPTSLVLTMSRRASVDQLLAVEGNSAEYSVTLRDVSAGGAGPTVIGPATLAGADTWRPVPAAAIDPDRLSSGDNYRIRITSRYTTGTSVLVSGSADYDNVVLHAVRSDGAGDGASRNSLRSKRLLALFRAGLSGTAILKGKRLFVRVSCPAAIGTSCRITAQGLLRKGKAVTAKRAVKVGKGRKRQVVLKVKRKFQARVAKRRRLLVSEKVRAGGATATAYKVRKLIRRR